MSIKNKLFSNTISNGLQFGSRWLINLMLAKSLSSSEFGTFSFIYSIGIILATFFSFGSSLYLLKELGEYENMEDKITLLIKSFLITIILFGFFTLICIVFLPNFINIFYGILLGVILAFNINIYYFFKGLGFFDKEAKAYIIYSVILLFIFAILFYFNLLSKMNIYLIFIILVFINFIPFLLGIVFFIKNYNFSYFKLKQYIFFSYKDLWIEFKKRFVYGLHELQSIFYTNLPTILMGILFSPSVLGIYKSIYLLITPILILPTILSQVLLNQLVNNKNNLNNFKKLFRKFLLISFLLGGIFILLYLMFGKIFVNLIYKEKFNLTISWNLLNIFIFSAFLWFIKVNYEILLTPLNKQWIRVKVLWLMIILYPILVFIVSTDIIVYKFAIAFLCNVFLICIIYCLYGELYLRKL